MREYNRHSVWASVCLNIALDGDEWSVVHPDSLTLRNKYGTYVTGGCGGRTAALKFIEDKKNVLLLQRFEHKVVQPID
jgi:hypothetical protein